MSYFCHCHPRQCISWHHNQSRTRSSSPVHRRPSGQPHLDASPPRTATAHPDTLTQSTRPPECFRAYEDELSAWQRARIVNSPTCSELGESIPWKTQEVCLGKCLLVVAIFLVPIDPCALSQRRRTVRTRRVSESFSRRLYQLGSRPSPRKLSALMRRDGLILVSRSSLVTSRTDASLRLLRRPASSVCAWKRIARQHFYQVFNRTTFAEDLYEVERRSLESSSPRCDPWTDCVHHLRPLHVALMCGASQVDVSTTCRRESDWLRCRFHMISRRQQYLLFFRNKLYIRDPRH